MHRKLSWQEGWGKLKTNDGYVTWRYQLEKRENNQSSGTAIIAIFSMYLKSSIGKQEVKLKIIANKRNRLAHSYKIIDRTHTAEVREKKKSSNH